MTNLYIANSAANFMGQFHGRHMILFVGQNTSEHDLKEYYAKMSWSCIVTSRNDNTTGNCFLTNDRVVNEVLQPNGILARPLSNKGELAILRLMGMNEPLSDEEQENIELMGLTEDEYKLEKARDMLQIVARLFDGPNKMVVTGYDPSAAGELPYRIFAQMLNSPSIRPEHIQFWGMDANDPRYAQLKKLADRKGFAWYPNSLAELIQFWDQERNPEDLATQLPGEKDEVFYKAGQAVGISAKIRLQYSFATLLTEQTINAVRPYGRIQQARWYYNFLTLSATEGPQWYGYLRSSEFYLRRDYEDAFVNLVRKQLNGNTPFKEGTNSPIILYGAPASSKSVTLGALAYRIFNEHINPVIYIKDDTLLFARESSETEDLYRFMERIDQIGTDTRILLIWDCSSYRNVAKNAQRLAKILTDRGRRFVLVCSAYDDPNPKEEVRKFFKHERTGERITFHDWNEHNFDVFWCNDCYYVPSKRDLSDNEQRWLCRKFSEFSGASKEHIQKVRTQIEDKPDIFEIFYKITSILRPKLEDALTREENLVKEYVLEQLKLIDPTSTPQKKSPSAFAQAFASARMDLAAFGIDVEALEEERSQAQGRADYDLDRFNTCIALFSRFKIEVPYALAMQMLKPEDKYLDDFTVNYDPVLFELMTTRIPWIRYGPSKGGNDFAFSFRNSLEAELFLSRNEISGKQQVKLLCDILAMYGAYYQKNRFLLDATLGSNLQHLIRLMGPNSQYPLFRSEKLCEHREIMRNLESIITLLEDLCIDQKFPDADAGFATILVTFSREYYGKKWESLYSPENQEAYSPEAYLYRIDKLKSMLEFASNKIDELEISTKELYGGSEKKHYSDQRNGLIVELAHCNILLKRLLRQYQERCTELGVPLSAEYDAFTGIPYRQIYNLLYRVILNNPSNGHAYNALFSSFEEMYENSSLREPQKLQYLSEIKLIADDCGSIDIRSRGADERDEIREHLQTISQYSNNYKVTIDDIHNNAVNEAFYTLYQNMIEANAPAAVTFVCQQELEKAKIDHKTVTINSYQRMVCHKVMSFMQEDVNAACIAGNYYALNLLLRVTWMYYTGMSLKDSPECQLIIMPIEKWQQILEISNACILAANRQSVGKAKPLIVLVNALATFQVTHDYHKCIQIVNTLKEDQFYFSPRMKVPFIICDAEAPVLYDGYVEEINGMNGHIILSNVPKQLSGKNGIRFHLSNLDRGLRLPSRGQRLDHLELGLGYTGFSIYSSEGRKFRGGQL